MASFQLHHSRHANLPVKILTIKSLHWKRERKSRIIAHLEFYFQQWKQNPPNRAQPYLMLFYRSRISRMAPKLGSLSELLHLNRLIFFSSWLNTKSIKLVGRKASGQGHAVQKNRNVLIAGVASNNCFRGQQLPTTRCKTEITELIIT